jgi:L-asparaginase
LPPQIVITHGTDTMPQTAQYLAGCFPTKTICITGSMRPERFSNSDAKVNLGMAIAVVQMSAPGSVSIAMHGLVINAADVTRDMESGQYQKKSEQEEGGVPGNEAAAPPAAATHEGEGEGEDV